MRPDSVQENLPAALPEVQWNFGPPEAAAEIAPPPAARKGLRLPHERDEARDPFDDVGAVPAPGPRQVIEQAASDVSHGLIDTEGRGTPSNVPAPGPDPEHSPGAEVPAGGIDRRSYAHRGEFRNSEAQ